MTTIAFVGRAAWSSPGTCSPASCASPNCAGWTSGCTTSIRRDWLAGAGRPVRIEGYRSTVDVHRGVLSAENGTAYEGLATDVAKGDTGLAFTLDPAFVASTHGAVLLRVTSRERDPEAAARGQSVVQYFGVGGVVSTSAPAPRSPGARWRTVTFALPDAALGGRLPGDATLRVALTGADGEADDVMVRFVRAGAARSAHALSLSPVTCSVIAAM